MKSEDYSIQLEADKKDILFCMHTLFVPVVACLSIWLLITLLPAGSEGYLFNLRVILYFWPQNFLFHRGLIEHGIDVQKIYLFQNCTSSFGFIFTLWLIWRILFEVSRNVIAITTAGIVLFLFLLPFSVIASFIDFKEVCTPTNLCYYSSMYKNIFVTLLIMTVFFMSIGEILAKIVSSVRVLVRR